MLKSLKDIKKRVRSTARAKILKKSINLYSYFQKTNFKFKHASTNHRNQRFPLEGPKEGRQDRFHQGQQDRRDQIQGPMLPIREIWKNLG